MLDRACTLIDRYWAKATAACLALALVVVVVAYATQPAQRDFDQVRDTLKDFVIAAGDRDGERACELLTETGRQAATAAVPGVSCPEYARSFGFDVAGLGSVKLNIPADLPDKVTLDAGNMNDAAGNPVQRRVGLVRVGDGYRIEGLQ